jgi:signal peptidase II
MPNTFNQTGWRYLWLTPVVWILDRYTKWAVVEHLDVYQVVQINSFLNITHVLNRGAAFGFLHSAEGWQSYLFVIIALAVCALLLWWLKHTPANQVRLSVAFCLIVGGALGNAYDRVMFGHVIDFIVLHHQHYEHWPAFNLADSAIALGAILLIIDMIKFKEDPHA